MAAMGIFAVLDAGPESAGAAMIVFRSISAETGNRLLCILKAKKGLKDSERAKRERNEGVYVAVTKTV